MSWRSRPDVETELRRQAGGRTGALHHPERAPAPWTPAGPCLPAPDHSEKGCAMRGVGFPVFAGVVLRFQTVPATGSDRPVGAADATDACVGLDVTKGARFLTSSGIPIEEGIAELFGASRDEQSAYLHGLGIDALAFEDLIPKRALRRRHSALRAGVGRGSERADRTRRGRSSSSTGPTGRCRSEGSAD